MKVLWVAGSCRQARMLDHRLAVHTSPGRSQKGSRGSSWSRLGGGPSTHVVRQAEAVTQRMLIGHPRCWRKKRLAAASDGMSLARPVSLRRRQSNRSLQ